MLEALDGHDPLVKMELAFGIVSEYAEYTHTNGSRSKEYHDALLVLSNELFMKAQRDAKKMCPADD